MCNSNLRLVAWIDGELSPTEAAAVERHVQDCPECRQCVAAYQGASREFAAYYSATTETAPVAKSPRQLSRWVPFAAAVAAAIVIALLFLPLAQKRPPAAPQVAKVVAPVEAEAPAKPVQAAPQVQPRAKRQVSPKSLPLHEDWAIGQPAIQIAIPADSMFPPGALPEGVAYIANVSFAADGSVQGIQLHP